MIRSLITLPYEVARLPLALLDRQLATTLPEESGPRVLVDRIIGTADTVAGTVLGNQDLAQRGAERLERRGQLVTAAALEEDAESRRATARRTAAAGRRQAAEKRQQAQDHAAAGLAEADAAESRGKQAATTRAAASAEATKSAADRRAAQRTDTVRRREQRAGSAARARKKVAQTKAEAGIAQARGTGSAASDARADAERLSDLTEAAKLDRERD